MSPRRFAPSRTQAAALSPLPRAYDPVVALWILRLIQAGGGLFAERRGRQDLCPETLEAAGLKPAGDRFEPLSPKSKRAREAQFQAALEAAEAEGPVLPWSTPLGRNLTWLGRAAGLRRTDLVILHFALVSLQHPWLENALDQMGGLSMVTLQNLLVRVLGLSRSAVIRSLESSSPLGRTGLLSVDKSANFVFRGKLGRPGSCSRTPPAAWASRRRTP